MATPAMRTITRLRASHSPLRLQFIKPPTSSPSRSYSSSLFRPLTLTHTTRFQQNTNTITPSPVKRPTLPSHHHHLPSQTRPFSLLPVLETAVSATQTILTTLHTAIGLPWYLTIPLFSLLWAAAARLPVMIYTRRVQIRRQRLSPLTHASISRVQRAMEEQNRAAAEAGGQGGQGSQGWGVTTTKSAAAAPGRVGSPTWATRFMKTNLALMRAREKRWGAQAWKDWAPMLMTVPFYVLGIEALRRMCGGPKGLLAWVMALGDKSGEAAAASKAVAGSGEAAGVVAADAASPAATPGEAGEAGVAVDAGEWSVAEGQGFEMASGAGGDLAVTEQPEVREALQGYYLADPSMTTGGCLWFPDLTVADPYHALPFIFSGVLVASAMPKTQQMWRLLLGLESMPPGTVAVAKWRIRFQRAMLMFALAIGPVTMGLPAALHLYWISAAAMNMAQTRIIWQLMPLPKNPTPARRADSYLVLPTRKGTKKP